MNAIVLKGRKAGVCRGVVIKTYDKHSTLKFLAPYIVGWVPFSWRYHMIIPVEETR